MSTVPLSESAAHDLKLHILLLSTYLDGRQQTTSKPHPEDKALDLFIDISTLLAVGNGHHTRAQNVNAVMGTVNINIESAALEVLVCAENAGQNHDKATASKKKGVLKGEHKADEVGDTNEILPDRILGRQSLNKWDGEMLDLEGIDSTKYVIPPSIFSSITLTTYFSSFAFEDHLQDLFNVIVSLDCNDPLDLHRFQRFIHHRAYRKLGYRVLDFSERWGISPIDIISENLDPASLDTITFRFSTHNPEFHKFIQKYLQPESLNTCSASDSRPSYSIRPDNAHLWVRALQKAWARLQKELLLDTTSKTNSEASSSPREAKKESQKKKPVYDSVNMDLPNNHRVAKLVILMNILDHLQKHVLPHLLSSPKVAQALAHAGTLEIPCVLIFLLIIIQSLGCIGRRQIL